MVTLQGVRHSAPIAVRAGKGVHIIGVVQAIPESGPELDPALGTEKEAVPIMPADIIRAVRALVETTLQLFHFILKDLVNLTDLLPDTEVDAAVPVARLHPVEAQVEH